ncbi:MAG: DUF4286 family protein [Bacteroidota bacterium]
MIIYNTTTKVDHSIHATWLKWMQQEYIPMVMESGYFTDYKLARLLGVDESDGITYAFQLSLANRVTFNLYQQKKALHHQSTFDKKYGERALSFRSVLDVVSHGVD